MLKLHSSDTGERDRLRKLVVEGVGAYDVVVTSYEMAKSPALKSALVQKIVWRCVVLDEGHVIKNEATEISQSVRKMHFVTAILLTGTPLQNNLTELWALLNFLYPDAFPERAVFDASYDLAKGTMANPRVCVCVCVCVSLLQRCIRISRTTRDDVETGVVNKAVMISAQRLLAELMLRRLKTQVPSFRMISVHIFTATYLWILSQVEKDLPLKLETVVNCPLAPQQLFWYRSLLLKERGALGKFEGQNGAAAPTGAYKSLMNLLMRGFLGARVLRRARVFFFFVSKKSARIISLSLSRAR